MPRTFGQKLKLLTLAKLLSERTDEDHPMTLAQMRTHLARAGINAERKSLYSDLEELQLFGMDIVRVKGKHTGYFLGERDFELPELRLLVDAVQSSRFLTSKKSAELIRKLQTLTSVHQAKSLSRQVTVAGRIKTMNESIYLNVDALSSAMDQDRAVSFLYFEWNSAGKKVPRRDGGRYVVSPYLLHWDNENYYLIGVEENSGAIRHFRVDKMQSIRQTDRERFGKEAFRDLDAAAYEKKTFGMFGGREESVTLFVREELAGVFFDRFGKLVTRKRDGGFETTVRVMISPPF
ncbi:MAG: WYL domain-containing protein, partial [Clostridia bacterium]|nr:WYL domain-containing protein [Clostridia bacterium]